MCSRKRISSLGVEEETSEEGRPPITLRDPGSPAQEAVQKHNLTHLPYRSLSPHAYLVGREIGHAGDARGKRRHRCRNMCVTAPDREPKVNMETVAILVIRDRWAHMLIAQVVPG